MGCRPRSTCPPGASRACLPSGIDLSSSALRYLSGLLTARRLERGTRWRRLPAGRQALLVLAHLRCGHTYAQLAAGFGVSTTTVYRYVTEAVEVLAALAPDIVTAARSAANKMFVVLDGTLLPMDRIAADRPYYSGHQTSQARHERPSPCRSVRAPAVGLTRSARSGPRHPRRPRPRHHRCPQQREPRMLGGQGLSGCLWHRPGALPRTVGETLRRSAGSQPITREDPRTGRAGDGRAEDLAATAKAAVQHHPCHQPDQGRPHPPPHLLKLRLEKAHWVLARPGARFQGCSPEASASCQPGAIHLATYRTRARALGVPQAHDQDPSAGSARPWRRRDGSHSKAPPFVGGVNKGMRVCSISTLSGAIDILEWSHLVHDWLR